MIAGSPDRPLLIGDVEIQCYVLEDEERVISQQGFLTALDRAPKAKARQGGEVDKLPAFLAADNLRPYVSRDLMTSTNPIRFQAPHGGVPGFGYRATLLPEVCNVYLRARADGVLRPSQMHIAHRAEVLIQGLATVGIVALVDEATGYQRVREERALATILERFIAKELQPWTRTFRTTFTRRSFGSRAGVTLKE